MARPKDAPPGSSLRSVVDEPGVTYRALGLGGYVAALATGACLFVAGMAPSIRERLIIWALPIGLLTGMLAAAASIVVSHYFGRGLGSFLAPSGSATPPPDGFSREDALAMRGQVAAALTSFEALIASSPGDVAVRLAAAEMYATRGKDAKRAAELFREARALPTCSARDELYASNRLIDLCIGSLDAPGRALVELRRIVDRHPGTPAAARARDAIARLKSSGSRQAGLGDAGT